MSDILIQFHALPEELALFAEEIARDFNTHILAIRLSPFHVIEVCTGKDACEGKAVRFVEQNPEYKRLLFTLVKPVLLSKNALDLTDKNPDSLELNLGRIVDRGFEQSWLTARTNNQEALMVWRKVAARLKRMTKSGLTAINPKTGASSRMASFRYTFKSKELESQGVAILPIAGGSLLKFD